VPLGEAAAREAAVLQRKVTHKETSASESSPRQFGIHFPGIAGSKTTGNSCTLEGT
jgi:hypothetical protein